jgi:hypothetical protein
MNDLVTWGAIIAAGSSLVAVIKFWMDMGQACQRADDAKAQSVLVSAKHDLLAANLNDYKVIVAQTYATTKALSEAEQSLGRSLETSTQGIYARLDTMTTRLDSLITIANRDHG